MEIGLSLLYIRVYEQINLGLIFLLILFPILTKSIPFKAVKRDNIAKLFSFWFASFCFFRRWYR